MRGGAQEQQQPPRGLSAPVDGSLKPSSLQIHRVVVLGVAMERGRDGAAGSSQEVQDDAALLSTLGVTAANPDDIERTLLAQVAFVSVLCIFVSLKIRVSVSVSCHWWSCRNFVENKCESIEQLVQLGEGVFELRWC